MGVLDVVIERAQQALSSSAEAQGYLRAQGVADKSVWSHYRLGATGPALFETFSAEERERLVELGLHTGKGGSPLRNPGVLIPTFDPRAPEVPVGFVKQAPAQNKHAAVGKPSGLACTPDVGQHPRIIITDNPLLMLRLAQRGAKSVALAEEAEALGPYANWLREREVILASYKKTVLTAREEHLKQIGVEARMVFVTTEWHRLSDEAVALLGIERPAAKPKCPKADTLAPTIACRTRPTKRKATQSVAVRQVERADSPAPAAAQTVAECGDTPPPALSLSYQAEVAPGTQGHAEHAPAPPPAEAVSPLAIEYPERPELVTHDTRMLRATFKAGDATYEVETAFDVGSKLEVSVERQHQKARDRFDLAKEAQRKRFATSAALRTGVPCEIVEAHLIVLLDAVRELQAAVLDPTKKATAPAAERMSDAERDEAAALLRRPDLLDAVAGELEQLGWVGEERLKRLLFLVSVSRKLDMPLHGALRSASASGKTFGLETICAVTPPEDLVSVSNLTGAALFHQQDGLRHKLLVLAESDLLEREVLVQLRVLLSEGVLRQAGTMRDLATGRVVSDLREASGPVAFLTSTTRDLDTEVLDRCYDLALDDSPEQTARILEAQRRRASNLQAAPERAGILARLWNLQRLIEPAPVTIPFAEQIAFPASSLRHRREQQRFLRLIESSALLHQHQRLKDGGSILADLRDYEIAIELSAEFIGRSSDELSAHARDVLVLVREAGLSVFEANDLKALRPNWTRHKVRTALAELLALEVVASSKRTRPRRYELLAGAAELWGTPSVPLHSASAIRRLAEIGEGPSPIPIPSQATG
ncbi:MAG: hypothetical protein AMXMBFR7_49240 [Planctomycetota bacterium]